MLLCQTSMLLEGKRPTPLLPCAGGPWKWQVQLSSSGVSGRPQGRICSQQTSAGSWRACIKVRPATHLPPLSLPSEERSVSRWMSFLTTSRRSLWQVEALDKSTKPALVQQLLLMRVYSQVRHSSLVKYFDQASGICFGFLSLVRKTSCDDNLQLDAADRGGAFL